MEYVLKEQKLLLLPEKAIWWEKEQMLLIADVHLGKVGHFRKAGIPIPNQVHLKDLERLDKLIQTYSPLSLTILGDLFHSQINSDWLLFEDWCERNVSHIAINLIKGNHDIISEKLFERNRITIYPETWEKLPFLFSHIPLETSKLNHSSYNLCGHLHPAITLHGKGRQSLRLPCFYFGNKQGYLPAFGDFTGAASIQVQENEAVFVIAGEKVMRVT
ncbi:MAG: ligase-associated DNA damage response endonuclease PdeM [Thermoflexibacter sp.]|jgi:DNA ligase-associated metallophosphoesterase|nr:ligase-associated DNA damage response endonuclease PdeM [Thermoflexibacter sp.]